MFKCFCEDPLPFDSEDIWATKCGHIFHHSCLLQWLEIKGSCPQCRTPLTSREIFRLYPTVNDDDEPNNELETVVKDALQSLENAQSELNQMTELCKKKDKVIGKLKDESKDNNTFKQRNEALKNLVLNSLSGDNLDSLFDDLESFDSVLKSKTIAIAKKSTESTINIEDPSDADVVEESDTEPSDTEEVDAESAAVQYSLDTLGDMISRISAIDYS